jgi:hypothetical protein
MLHWRPDGLKPALLLFPWVEVSASRGRTPLGS